MSDDAPVVPDQWTVLDFDVDSEQLDVAFARQDRSAMVVLDRTRMQETAPEFLVDCRQFVVDPQDGVEAGTYVTAKVALARAIPEAVDYARQYMHEFDSGMEHIRCFGSDVWKDFRQFYVSGTELPEDLDPETLVTVLNEDEPGSSLPSDVIEDGAELETFDPAVDETPDLVIDVDVFPRHLDSVWAVEDDSFPYQSPPTDRFDAWYGSPDDVLGGSSQQ